GSRDGLSAMWPKLSVSVGRHSITPVVPSSSKGFPDRCPVPADSAQSQAHRRRPQLRRALACRTRCAKVGNPDAGGPAPFSHCSSSRLSGSSPGTAPKKTHDLTPIGLTPRLADGRYLQEQYKTLRREALKKDWGERGHGMAPFLTRGSA